MVIEQAIEIIEWLPAQNRWEEEAKDMAISALRDQAGNLVEVVRCQDCVHCHEVILTHWCNWWGDVTELNGYCSCGERRAK